MPPQFIMIIRHAEKPPDDGSKTGIQEDGTADSESLIVQGWQRAGALTGLFGGQSTRALPRPDAVYAAAIAPQSKSRRPQQTVQPLCGFVRSQGYALAVNTSHAKGDEPAMLSDVLKQPGIVLICWQHEAIPGIANAILNAAALSPQKWPGNRFDMVWVFEAAGGSWRFSQVPQLLLAGDLDTPMAN